MSTAAPSYDEFLAAQTRIAEDQRLTAKFEQDRVNAALAAFEVTGAKNFITKLTELSEELPAGTAKTAILGLIANVQGTTGQLQSANARLGMILNPPVAPAIPVATSGT